MRLYSTKHPRLSATFMEAVERGTPGDGGLYMFRGIPSFPREFFRSLCGMPFQEIAFHVARLSMDGDIPDHALQRIVEESITFPAPLRMLDERTAVLELFHGPTLAFKDFGARFMARVMAYLHSDDRKPTTVLVATSGDTGSAVAHGFRDAEGISVVLLYPSGRVAPMQELQLTTAGSHVAALEILGTFDDCQRLVKQAFADPELSARRRLTSANSINIARLIPQTFYYFNAVAQLKPDSPPVVFAVPSGNLGNLTAGLMAEKMGLPVELFVAGSNVNDTLIRFLSTGVVEP
ncbi:threonine synthase, partial [bacterium]